MTWCEVVFVGRDQKNYSHLVEGRSLYHAAAQALEQASRLWWFDPTQVVLVRVLEQTAEYRLTAQQVRLWEARQSRKPGGQSSAVQ